MKIHSKIKCRSSERRCSIKKRSQKFRNIHREIPVLESLFNKVAGLQVLRAPNYKTSPNGYFKNLKLNQGATEMFISEFAIKENL